MKILGHERLAIQEKTIPIGRAEDGTPIRLTFVAPTLTAIAEVENGLKAPEPPPSGQVKRDDRGRIVKDARGVPKMEPDYQDPGYLADLKKTQYARMVGIILACLKPGQVEFGARKEDYPNATAYYLAILDEMEAAGVTMNVLMGLEQKLAPWMNMMPAEVEVSQEVLGVESLGEEDRQASPTSP